MEGQVGAVERVLVATRGEVARRLIRFYRDAGIESVVVFSEADAEQPYLDDADYAVYLNGRTVADTYLHPTRVVSAAVDAGCDAIHPGYCFLAEHLGFHQAAIHANVQVIGAELRALAAVVQRTQLRALARELGIPVIPATDALGEDDDGMQAATAVGMPLFVKAVHGKARRRVDRYEDLPAVVRAVREEARRVTGDPSVFLERAVDDLRRVGTVVVADSVGASTAKGRCVSLSETESSVEHGYRTWVEEMGPEILPRLRPTLGDAAVRLVERVGWSGVGRARWAITRHGGWFLLGFSGRLTTGFDLVEAVHGIDLLHAQQEISTASPLPWDVADSHHLAPSHHGIQVRLFHVDPRTGERPAGRIGRLALPVGAACSASVEEGASCDADTDPLLVKVTVTAPTRHAAIVMVREALSEVVVEGVPTNLDAVRRLVATERFWRGEATEADVAEAVMAPS